MGISKDGRVIYGPVKEFDKETDKMTQFTPCDLDVCNGRIDDKSGTYMYHASSFHPYIPVCFGPGQRS